ncbi:MAG: L-histidine N(alpha)-methyltransferase [Rhizobiales bacterium]|nr:L-histidine N(alpha)-methyltransferase [Hyphomicrobiales bacterium]
MAVPVLKIAPKTEAESAFAHDVREGLSLQRKHIPPKYFYDDEGCKLFEQITEQPEYYPTRCEMQALQTHATEIAALFPQDASLVEFGTCTTTKARILLNAAPQLSAYVPIDIAADQLRSEALAVREDFPNLEVVPVVADFAQDFELPEAVRSKPCVGFFPGSTIGNFERHDATAFLQRAAKLLGRNSLLIIGVDLVKDSKILNAAYNDAAGVTEAFNLNLLKRIDRELGADFNPTCFEHHAFFNREKGRVEMHLAAVKRHKVHVLGETIDFRAGETIHTENSYKYSIEGFSALARGAGWTPVKYWTDSTGYFSIHALRMIAKNNH